MDTNAPTPIPNMTRAPTPLPPTKSPHPIMDAVDRGARITGRTVIGGIMVAMIGPRTIIHAVAAVPISAIFAVRSAIKYGDLRAVPACLHVTYPFIELRDTILFLIDVIPLERTDHLLEHMNHVCDVVQRYKSRGYAVFRNLVSEPMVNLLNAEMDLLARTLPVSEEVFDEDRTGKIKQIQYLHQKSTICAQLLEQLKPLGTSIIGHDRFSVLNMQLFEKHPGISKPTRAHQDNAYFKLSPATAVTLWVSLDAIDEDNGCLYYAPGSHLRPTHKHSSYHADTTFRVRSGVMGLSLCLHEHPEETDVAVQTFPGDVVAHNCNTIHRAGKNGTKDRRRRAIGIVFVPDECETDALLEKYHQDRLRADIELQRIKNPGLYRDLTAASNP